MSVISPIRSVTAAAAASETRSSWPGYATRPIVASVEKPIASARRAHATSAAPVGARHRVRQADPDVHRRSPPPGHGRQQRHLVARRGARCAPRPRSPFTTTAPVAMIRSNTAEPLGERGQHARDVGRRRPRPRTRRPARGATRTAAPSPSPTPGYGPGRIDGRVAAGTSGTLGRGWPGSRSSPIALPPRSSPSRPRSAGTRREGRTVRLRCRSPARPDLAPSVVFADCGWSRNAAHRVAVRQLGDRAAVAPVVGVLAPADRTAPLARGRSTTSCRRRRRRRSSASGSRSSRPARANCGDAVLRLGPLADQRRDVPGRGGRPRARPHLQGVRAAAVPRRAPGPRVHAGARSCRRSGDTTSTAARGRSTCTCARLRAKLGPEHEQPDRHDPGRRVPRRRPRPTLTTTPESSPLRRLPCVRI